MPAGTAFPELDIAPIARLYAAFARSSWADAADRAAADQLDGRFPGAFRRMERAREFHARAARVAVTRAARGVVFAAAGFPARPLLHEAALAANPSARFCYADPDPVVAEIREALHTVPGQVAACAASARDPGGLLSCPEVEDLPRPLHVQVMLALHFWPAACARRIIAGYGKLLPPGSVLLNTWTVPAATPRGRDLAEAVSRVAGTPLRRHAPRTVTGWLEDAGFTILQPGIRDVRAWSMPWPHLDERGRTASRVMGVIARAG